MGQWFEFLRSIRDGTNINKTIAVKLATLSDIVQVAAGAEFSFFLKKMAPFGLADIMVLVNLEMEP
ncbi:MAG: hypothetical protein IPL42_10100 [Saprospiraceae bacterium]|nr:hypothetical protein [Saprospiraceae bacterium]